MALKIIKASERTVKPPRVLIYGREGIGKTWFAAGMPSPIFIPLEDGQGSGVKADSFPVVESYQDLLDALKGLVAEQHEYRTVVIDHMDGVERLLHEHLIKKSKVTNIIEACGGYGKAFQEVIKLLTKEIFPLLTELRDKKNMWVCMLAHAGVKEIKEPNNTHDEYVLRTIREDFADQLTQWVDCVFYATMQYPNAPEGAGNKRVLKAQPSNIYYAKNRYGNFTECELNFNALQNAIKTSTNKGE